MPRNDDLFALLNEVEQRAQSVLGLEGPDLTHPSLPNQLTQLTCCGEKPASSA
jgi:hypothetical protein